MKEVLKVNFEAHSSYQGTDSNPDDPQWLERLQNQARMFVELFREKIFDPQWKIIDYGCGDGKLADMINEKIETSPIKKYDEYMSIGGGYDLSKSDLVEKSFDVVANFSLIEHLIGKKDVDKILNLMKPNGIFVMCTSVVEEVPQDPDWHYLLPVHCTMWTNKAMQILYEQQKFRGCAYNLEARTWIMFRNRDLFENLKAVKENLSGKWFFSDDFVDYWKVKPYRD